jgi:hypothetical protein
LPRFVLAIDPDGSSPGWSNEGPSLFHGYRQPGIKHAKTSRSMHVPNELRLKSVPFPHKVLEEVTMMPYFVTQ